MGQWQPGQSGNPAGASTRIKPWREAIHRALKREQRLLFDGKRLHPSIISTHDDNGTCIVPEGQLLELIADMTVQRAVCGDHDAMIEVGNRLDGRAPQTLEGSDVPIIHTVKWLDDDDPPGAGDGAEDEQTAPILNGLPTGEGDPVNPVPGGNLNEPKRIEFDDRWEDEVEEAIKEDDNGSERQAERDRQA